MSILPRACMTSTIWPTVTSRPSERSRRPNTSRFGTSDPRPTCDPPSSLPTRPYSSQHGTRQQPAEAFAAQGLDVLTGLENHPERLLHGLRVQVLASERDERCSPIERLRNAWHFVQFCRAKLLDDGRDLFGEPGVGARHLALEDTKLFLEARIVNPLIEASSFERVVDLARPVRRQDHNRRLDGPDGAELGNRHLKLGEELEQEALEFLVCTIDFVDQEHRRPPADTLEGPQQRTLDEEVLAENLPPSLTPVDHVCCLEHPQLDNLSRVVPLVDRVVA